MNPYTPEAAQQKYPGAPQKQSRYPWRASGASRPKPQQNTGGQQEAAPGPQKAPDMSMYSPGQAQPIQPQSQGTPYGAQPDGNYAYATPNNRPAPFTQRYTNFDGTQSEQPNFGQRDAFIQNINDSMLPYYGGKAQGAPQFDFQSMYRRAGDMVKDGWQNPFSMRPQVAPYDRTGLTGDPRFAASNNALGFNSWGQPGIQQLPQQPSLEQQLSQYAPQPQYQPADPVRYDTGPYDPNGGRVIGGDRLPVVATQPATGGEWRPTARNPYAPLAYYPDGSDTPDPSYGTRPGRMPRPGEDPQGAITRDRPPQPAEGPATPLNYDNPGAWSDADIERANNSQFGPNGERPFHPVRYTRDAQGNVVMRPGMLGMKPVTYGKDGSRTGGGWDLGPLRAEALRRLEARRDTDL